MGRVAKFILNSDTVNACLLYTSSEGFEVLDGQQRTISLCEYVDGTFSVDDKYFYNLPADKKQQILDYPLFVYCLLYTSRCV